MNNEEIKWNLERVFNIKPFINKYDRDRIKSENIHQKLMATKCLRKVIQQLLMFFYIKEMEICLAYISKINSNCEEQIILLMITNGEKKAGITSKK